MQLLNAMPTRKPLLGSQIRIAVLKKAKRHQNMWGHLVLIKIYVKTCPDTQVTRHLFHVRQTVCHLRI